MHIFDFVHILSLNSWLIVGITALSAGIIDSIAGGGGLLTVPILMSVGNIPYTTILGTNKLQGFVGAFSSSTYYIRVGIVKPKNEIKTIFFTIIGSMFGVWFAHIINKHMWVVIMPFFLMLILTVLALIKMPSHRENVKGKMKDLTFSLIFGLAIGCYDGFFGPGTGTFWMLSYVLVMGLGSIHATGKAKVMNASSNITALILFALAGNIYYSIGIFMAIFQFIGANIGSRLAVKNGSKIIKPLVIIITILMILKLIYTTPDNPLNFYVKYFFDKTLHLESYLVFLT